MFVPGQDKSLKARRLVGHFARQALCWARVRREPLVPYRRQSEDYRETKQTLALYRRSGKLGFAAAGFT